MQPHPLVKSFWAILVRFGLNVGKIKGAQNPNFLNLTIIREKFWL